MRTRPAVVAALLAASLLFATGGARADGVAAAADYPSFLGSPAGRPIAGAELDTRTDEVASLVRCPVCQGLSVADSPSPLALAMKKQTKEMLAAGYDQEQVLSYFERSYGEFVRLEPRRRGLNWLVWLAPPAALAAGLGVVALALRRLRRPIGAEAVGATVDDPPGPHTLPEDPRIAAYVKAARALAYGSSGVARAKPTLW